MNRSVRTTALVSVTVLCVALLLAGGRPASAAEIELKGVSNSRPQVQFKMWEWMQQELPKRTNGRVALTPTSLPELGLTGFELVRVLRAGLVDLADVLPTYVSGDVPLIEGVDLPGFFSFDEFDKSGVKFGLEVHPTEIAYDYFTAQRALAAVDRRPLARWLRERAHVRGGLARASVRAEPALLVPRRVHGRRLAARGSGGDVPEPGRATRRDARAVGGARRVRR